MKKSLLAITAASVLLTACSTGVREHWKNYSSDSLSTAELQDKQALAVFYRTAEFQGPALNVYIDGDYQASVLAKGYTPIAICANNQLISASFTTSKHFGNRTQGARHTLAEKEIAYFRATTDAKGNPTFEAVEESEARQELKGLTGKVSNTLSRVTTNKSCQ